MEKNLLPLLSMETLEKLHAATDAAVNEMQGLVPDQQERFHSESYVTLMGLECELFQIMRKRILGDTAAQPLRTMA